MNSGFSIIKAQSNTKILFESIKSNFILKKIMNIINKKKLLEIVKINKKLLKKLDLNINDYKEFTQLYSSIEIELNIEGNKYGKFINITDKLKEYFHIYFNDSNEETKKNYLEKNDKVKKIKIIINHQVTSFKDLFYSCECINSIYFKKFYNINITNMSCMFSGCSSLKELNLSNFNTNNVTNMSYMISRCPSLAKLDLSNFNTNNVTDMSRMFYGCSSLKELNLSNFNTNKVINMSGMFYGCSSLEELKVSNFNTDNVINMGGMFAECSSLKELNVSQFNIDNIKNMSNMFSECSSELINKIKVQNINLEI